jgi:hypothetical protein
MFNSPKVLTFYSNTSMNVNCPTYGEDIKILDTLKKHVQLLIPTLHLPQNKKQSSARFC